MKLFLLTIKLLGSLVVIIVLFLIGCIILIPTPNIDPEPFHPNSLPRMTGILSPNKDLVEAMLIGKGQLMGPEDVAISQRGEIFTGCEDGWIRKILQDGTVQNFAYTGGRPLGLKFSPDSNLIVADAIRGLLSISPAGEITTLISSDEDTFGLIDDLDISSDGIIYFSDATTPILRNDFYWDILIHRPFGHLMYYNLKNGQLGVLMDSLYFANGVALSPREDFVLVSETSQYQISRYWLKGIKLGIRDIFAQNLPGFPDGIMGDGKGNYWVALVSPRKWAVDHIYASRLWLRRIFMHLPKWIRPKATPYGLVVQLDSQGNIIKSMHDPNGERLSQITNVVEQNGNLYFGTLSGEAIGFHKM